MSGSRAKQRRRDEGISIAARRGQSQFNRDIAQAIHRRTEERFAGRRARRYVLAWVALVAIIAAVVVALFGSL